jgi:hypothetical protein
MMEDVATLFPIGARRELDWVLGKSFNRDNDTRMTNDMEEDEGKEDTVNERERGDQDGIDEEDC